MSSTTPRKRLHNDENAGTPAQVVSNPRDPFRTPFQPQQLISFTPSTPVIRTDSFVDAFTPVEKKRRVVRKHKEEELAEIRHATTERRAHEQTQASQYGHSCFKLPPEGALTQFFKGEVGNIFKVDF